MKQKKFSYSTSKQLIIICCIWGGMCALFAIFFFPLLKMFDLSGYLFMTTVFLVMASPTINRTFFIKITIDDDLVSYRGLFREYTLSKKDIVEISKIQQAGKHLINIDSIHNANEIDKGSIIYLSSDIQSYPRTTYSILFRPATKKYITFNYRDDLYDVINELINKENE